MSDIPATFYIDKAISYAAAANMHPSDITDAIGEKRQLLVRIAELEADRDKYKWQLKTAIDDEGEDDDQRRQQWVKRELADLDRRWAER